MSSSVAERIAAFEQHAATSLPAEALAVFGAERASQGQRVATGGVGVGSPMPDGDLVDAHGAPTTLAAARAGAGGSTCTPTTAPAPSRRRS